MFVGVSMYVFVSVYICVCVTYTTKVMLYRGAHGIAAQVSAGTHLYSSPPLRNPTPARQSLLPFLHPLATTLLSVAMN